MASVVTLITEKTMKKIFKKKFISDLPTLIFSRYETGTTGIFLGLISSCCVSLLFLSKSFQDAERLLI
jgi:hypothetical protein